MLLGQPECPPQILTYEKKGRPKPCRSVMSRCTRWCRRPKVKMSAARCAATIRTASTSPRRARPRTTADKRPATFYPHKQPVRLDRELGAEHLRGRRPFGRPHQHLPKAPSSSSGFRHSPWRATGQVQADPLREIHPLPLAAWSTGPVPQVGQRRHNGAPRSAQPLVVEWLVSAASTGSPSADQRRGRPPAPRSSGRAGRHARDRPAQASGKAGASPAR